MKTSFFTVFYAVFLFFLFVLVSCPSMGQELSQKKLTEVDYKQWSTMEGEQLSENGNWVSYRFSYEGNIDTTFVVNTATLQKYIFPSLKVGQFVKEHSFVYQKEQNLMIFNLETATETQIANVSKYDFSTDGKHLVTYENQNTLIIRKNGVKQHSFENVSGYQWNYEKNTLVYAQSKEPFTAIGHLSFEGSVKNKLLGTLRGKLVDAIKWQVAGKAFSFYAVSYDEVVLYYYDIKVKKLWALKSTDSNFIKDMKILPNYTVALSVSRDGKKVFFGITPVTPKDTTSLSKGVEVWNASDQILFRKRKLKATVIYPNYLAVWYPKDSIVRQITTEEQSWVALNGNQAYALVADIKQYEPQYERIARMDYYLMNLKTGDKKLFLRAYSGYDGHLNFSPDGRYISYYKDRNWWSYAIATAKHVNLSQGIATSWDNSESDPDTELQLWGQAGWTKEGRFVLCYDYHDIWAFSLDGLQRKRLTTGKEQQMRFRINKAFITNVQEFNYSKTPTKIFDITQEILLDVTNTVSGASGYYLLFNEKDTKKFLMEDVAIGNLKKAPMKEACIYVKQDFDQPPALFFKKSKEKGKLIVQSNPQHYTYQWGFSETIYYKDSKGNFLKGALFYPASYTKGQTYPLIVSIYENLSQHVHTYVNPSLHNRIGLNIANFVTQGYAVLLPDIAYESGNPGKSATDCVTAAVNQVIAIGVADEAKIGLMGQSFGGYETNIIITQTDLFAAAISGCGVGNSIDSYFTLHLDDNKINAWRFENQQFRMGFPFYENQEAYYANSPLHNAKNINTPLLTWTGKLDNNVQPRQSEVLYAALRRLNKEHIMLVYDNDGHIFRNPKNQEDLTYKILDWFNHYLKGEPKAQWMKSDVEK